MRVMKVRRPGSRFGSSLSIERSASSAVVVGPSFTPIGLRTRERKSTCAPSSSRVRSPIQRKCAEVSYGSAGARVDAGQRALVVHQQRLVARVELDALERLEVGAARGHELDGAVDLAGQRLVAGVGRVLGEALVPASAPGAGRRSRPV